MVKKRDAEIAQLVEHDLAKVGVASSSLVFRSGLLNQREKGSGGGMVDTRDLKSLARKGVWVQVPPGVPKRKRKRVCGNSSVGRARPCQGRGREFESRFPLKGRKSGKSNLKCCCSGKVHVHKRCLPGRPMHVAGTQAKEREKNVLVAQLVEQLTLNQWVQGSNPCQDTYRGV